MGPFREFGWRAGALYVLGRLLRAVSPELGLFVYELMVQPISGKALLPPNLAKNLRFAEIEPADADIARMPARTDIKLARFAQGARCLGAYRKGQLIGYIWFSFDRYDEDEVRCTYELAASGQSVFDFDLYLFPEHRMGIGFMAIWHGANDYLRERGILYTFSRLTRFNLASRRAHAHLGWRCVGRAVFLQAWRLEIMAATLYPYLAVSWSAHQRITLQLKPDVLAGAPAAVAVKPDIGRRA